MAWYIVDGMDGAGKTTSSKCLEEYLESQGRRVLRLEHPNRETRLGRTEAELLTKKGKAALVMAILLYITDVTRSIWVMKHRGREYDDVVFVRYIMAVAYLPMKPAKLAYRFFERVFPTPDVEIFIDIDEDTALARILERGEELEVFESREKLRATREKMLALTDGWEIVDNTGTRAETDEQIREILRRRVPDASA